MSFQSKIIDFSQNNGEYFPYIVLDYDIGNSQSRHCKAATACKQRFATARKKFKQCNRPFRRYFRNAQRTSVKCKTWSANQRLQQHKRKCQAQTYHSGTDHLSHHGQTDRTAKRQNSLRFTCMPKLTCKTCRQAMLVLMFLDLFIAHSRIVLVTDETDMCL